MRPPVAPRCVTLSLTVAIAIGAAPLQPAHADMRETCQAAVIGARRAMELEQGITIEAVTVHDSTAMGYAAVIDQNGDRRDVGYSFLMAVDDRSTNFINSPVLMRSYAQSVANDCGDLSMVTFVMNGEGPWGETFGVDETVTMFRFRCIGAGSLEARQKPLPWGSVICG